MTYEITVIPGHAESNRLKASTINPTRPSRVATGKPAEGVVVTPAGFDQTLKLQGIGFRVSSLNQGSLNRLPLPAHGHLLPREFFKPCGAGCLQHFLNPLR